jgi:hypothetical protein
MMNTFTPHLVGRHGRGIAQHLRGCAVDLCGEV